MGLGSSNACIWTAFTSPTLTQHYTSVPSSISRNSSAPTAGSISGFQSYTRKNNGWPFGCLQGRSRHRSTSGSCTRPLRTIILPPNRVQCPQLNLFWRGQGHGLTPFVLPTCRVGTRMALRSVACTESKPGLPALPMPAKPKRQRSSAPKPFAGLTHRPPCALCERETVHPNPSAPVPPDPLPPTNRRPRTVDTSRHFCPHTDC